MYQSVSVPVALRTVLALTLVLPVVVTACPRSCNCYQASEVHCTFRSLLAIPPGLPAHTRRVNLGFNSISRINDRSLTGLKRLELLMLHSNDIRHIPDAVFRDLKSLQILKLSYNKLREIPSSLTFSGLTSLLRLYLDHNLLEHIHPRALLQLPSLRLLRLQGNRLHQLHPHTLCTLSLLNTYYFSTLRHLDLSNNTLTTLAKATLATAPLLETLVVQDNPWSCDCRMNWFLAWILDHPGLMKCPGGPQCPICASPDSLQGHALLEQSDLSCTSPVIPSVGREGPLEADISEILSSESFREPLGSASLDLSDQQGNNVNLSCNITRSSDYQDSTPFPDLSLSSSSPLPLALSLSLDCPVERQKYEKLWRILAYYSETAVRLEREIMLSKAPTLAYRYKQTAETVGYYHSGVKASVKTRPHWLLQPAISIQLNRAQSNGHKVQLIYSTRVSAHSDSTISHPWVLFSTNQTATALAAAAGSKVELPCPVLSSGNPKVQWILPDGSKHVSPYNSLDSRMWVSATGLVLQKVQLSDAGIYYCVAQAGRDVDVLPLRLAVAESSIPPSGEPVGPSIASGVGQPVILSCNASGSPEPQISWLLPDGNIVRRGLAISGGLTVQLNGSLSLANLSQRDAGYYRCVAVNQYGSDSLSMQLELHPQHPPLLKTYFSRGPQSAAGRSTKIRAPLLFQVGEGSGDEEEKEDRTLFGNKRRPRPFQPSTKRHYPAGNPRRRGPVRGPPRRGPLSSTDQRRNHLQNRYRVTSNKQRIDPQKWADLLAKIRQKTAHTNNNELDRTGKPKAEVGTSKSEDRDDDLESDRIEGTMLELETEESSADIPNLQEEGLQPIQPILIVTDAEADTEIKHGVVRSTVKPTEIENESETHVPREKAGLQTEIVRNPDSLKEPFTSKPILVTNKIIQEPGEADEREADPSPSRIHPQKHQQGVLPNLIPNSRPQRPWHSRRRIGQRRRIINRPGLRPPMPPQLLPDPSNPKSQNETFKTITDQTSLLLLTSTTSSPANLLLQNVALNYLPTSLSHTSGTTTSAFDSPSVTSFPSSLTSVSPTSTDMMTLSANIPDPADFTPTPTPLDNSTTAKHVSDTYSTQTETKIHTAVGKPVDRPSDTHREELGRMNTPYMSHSHSSILPPLSSIIPSTVPITSTFTSATEKTPSAAPESTPLSSTSTSTTDTLCTTTVDPVTTTTAIIPPPSSTRSTKTMFTTVTSTTPRPTSTTTTTTTTAITSTIPATTTTSATTTIPVAISPYPSHIATRTATKTAAPATSRITISAKTSITATKATTSSAASTTIMAMIPITASSKEGINVDQVDQRGRPVSAVPNHRRFPTDWNNPGANSIPDSHSSRRRQPSSPPLPAAPGAPVLRFRPRIADPRIRTASFPVESTARLPCVAQGVPKPSITWTKVATGAVMSIRSRAQRFEVLPNGTLVIQNLQLQDRGTYICSAHSFLGRDRLLTTLEVWTRPPRMGVPTYRETTIHQGGELHLECQAEGVPTPLLSWVLPDRSVLTSNASFSSRITMDTNATLHISVILPSDRGMYRCMASNPAGAASASVNIHVSSLPPVIQLPRKERLLLSPGMPVYAHCTARGAPPPTLRWRIPDGTLVRPSQFFHNIFVLPNGTLHIQKVGPKDAGNYECTASNAVGSDKRIVRVEIEGLAKGEKRQEGATNDSAKVVISDKTSSSSLLLNDRNMSTQIHPSHPYSSNRFSPSLPFEGTLSSSHLSSYPHQHNSTKTPAEISKSLAVSPIHVTNTNKSRPSSFSPQSIRPTENSNVSSGFLSNTSYFPADKSRALAVLHPLPVSPFSKARIVSTSPSISTVHHGGDLQLHCSVTGNPPPIIIWRTPSKKLVDRNFSFDRRLKVHPNGTLSVRAVTEKDNGDYLCITRNKVADDYRLLRVSVSTKPAKIEPKQPLNQMVLFGKPLKVDCQASGLPDPAVHWKLPDGTMVNSVLQSELGGRARRLIVFDNGTLVVPAVGMGEEGEYTCYAENQGGQDTMKVKVKVMMAYSPTFTNDKSYYSVKVQQGMTATLRCQATGNPVPTITWFSPRQRAIPQSLGSRLYFERVAVVSDGTLEVRQAQKLDTGNYTCRASNSAGERSMVVGLEVEASNYGLGDWVGGRGWSPNKGPGSTYSSGSGGSINNAGISRDGFTNGAGGKLDNSYSNSDNSDNNGEKMKSVPKTSAQTGNSGSNPTFKTNAQNKFDQPVHTITTQLGSTLISVGLGKNTDIKANQIGPNPNGPSIESGRYNTGNNHTTVRESTERNSVFNNNDVNERKASNANTKEDTGRISGTSHNVGVFRSSVSNIGAATSTGAGMISENSGSRSSSTTGTNPSKTHSKNTTNTIVGVATVKQKALKGQTLLLPCPSQGSPPPRLAWHLPGNGVLPAPYYGSRFTVYRNGSLELRGVRVSDGGTFVCVVRGERQEVRIQVELEVSEPLEEARASHRGSGGERFVPESSRSHSRASVDIPQSVNSRSVLPERLRSRNPVTQKPLQKGLSFPSAPLPIVPPPRLTTPVSEPVVRTRTDPLVTIINGETLHLPCPASQTPGHTRGSLSWTLPNGKVLSFSESGDSGRHWIQEDGTLTVQQTSVFDRGTYTCRSTSYDSTSVSAVTIPVIIIAYPPRITMGPSPLTYTRPGVAVELPCLTIATPRATVTWETPDLTRLKVMGQARIYGNRYLSSQGSLVIQNPTDRDTGFYKCTANNEIGVDTKVTYLRVI